MDKCSLQIHHYLTFCFIIIYLFISCSNISESNELVLNENWRIMSSALAAADGAEISSELFETQDWYTAEVPSTVMAVLLKNNVYKDIFTGKNLEQVSPAPYDTSWWYRTNFDLKDVHTHRSARLIFEGINYRANIWLNGKQIASADSVYGSFRVFKFDVKRNIKTGINVLAVEVIPPGPDDFTIGFVDWNPPPPDKNMGLWRPVKLRLTGAVSLHHPFVRSKVNIETLKEAELSLGVELINHNNKPINGWLFGQIDSIYFEKNIKLEANQKKVVHFSTDKFGQLRFKNPRLWWPNNLGAASLYNLKFHFETDKGRSDQRELTFGIRDVSDYMTDQGYRGFKINGKKILIRGGGWVDDLFLADTPEKLEAQVKYAKHMNLNAIRLEGFWGTDHTLYDLCDRYGILIMAGWSCQWEWQEYIGKACDEFGAIRTADDIDLIAESWRDQITMFRNHPSVFLWLGGSDKLPRPPLEQKYLDILNKTDPSRPYIGAAKNLKSKISGPGPQPPPYESLLKMLPAENQWPIDDVWEYHCGRRQFNTLKRYKAALDERYGKVKNIEDFAQTAQLANYEAMRAMFEAFAVNKYQSTGIIQWMLNSAWPGMYWQLYDYYLRPNGAFYAARKAAAPLQIIYNYVDKNIYINNDYFEDRSAIIARIRIFNMDSKNILDENMDINIPANAAQLIYKLPQLPHLTGVYFLDLRLIEDSEMLAHNFYWLSTKEDVMDFPASNWFVTLVKEYADFTALRKLTPASVKSDFKFRREGDKRQISLNLHNCGKNIAFFIDFDVLGKNGQPVLPVFWDDNYISLLPGEERTVTAYFYERDLQGADPGLNISGWNLTH